MPWRLNWRALNEGGALLTYYPPLRRPYEQERPGLPAILAGPQVACPRCSGLSSVDGLVCVHCGFPFICDITPVPRHRPAEMPLWRRVIGAALMLYMLLSGVSTIGSNSAYLGHSTKLASSISVPADLRIPISGPEGFVLRTGLALGLLSERAPEFYLRLQQNVSRIAYHDQPVLAGPGGKPISLEGIGALSEPGTGRVLVLMGTAFPSGKGEFWDSDLYSYAGVLVHELRHIELHRAGTAPGGVEEEVLCEQAAYSALKQAGAPPGVMARYEMYFANPRDRSYQRWYDWYKQW